jgi:hypothetical protein
LGEGARAGKVFLHSRQSAVWGAKYQTPAKREQVRRIASLGGSGGTLDYVCAWFVKAGEYLRQSKARIGFVATNSITQGEQVAQLWPRLFERYALEIAFAHRTFAWMSDARGKAHVHCVIVGLTRRDDEPKEKRLFSYDDIKGDPKESKHGVLSPYLIDASKFLRPYLGSDEFINGDIRYILALQSVLPEVLRTMPKVVERMNWSATFAAAKSRRKRRSLRGKPRSRRGEKIRSNWLTIHRVSMSTWLQKRGFS